MKKISNAARCIFSIMFVIYGLSNFTNSVVASILSISLGISLFPPAWNMLGKKDRARKWCKILLPFSLLFATAFAAINVPGQESFIQDTATAASVSKDTVGWAADDSNRLEIHYIDVDQGDATLIKCGSEAMLIDAGDNSKGTAVQLYLQKQGISKLDYVIGTHHDADHIGGLDVILTKFNCGTIIMPNDYKDTDTYRDVILAMDFKGYKNTIPVSGTKYQLGDAEFTILQHSEYGAHTNNSSVGIILTHGDKQFLFTGDAEEEAEADIVNSGLDLLCDVYKAGHHGSHTSSSATLLHAAKPLYAVISCGEGNDYGHPRAETLNHFRTKGIKVFRTDEQGTIVAISNGREITWNCAPSTSWIAGEPANTQNQGQQENITYVLNTNSKKFHRTTCNTLPDGGNRKNTDLSREIVIEGGYIPCKRCNP